MILNLLVKNREYPEYFKDWVDYEPKATKTVDKYYTFIFLELLFVFIFPSLLFYVVRLVSFTDSGFSEGLPLDREEDRKPHSCQTIILICRIEQNNVHVCSKFYLNSIKIEIFY